MAYEDSFVVHVHVLEHGILSQLSTNSNTETSAPYTEMLRDDQFSSLHYRVMWIREKRSYIIAEKLETLDIKWGGNHRCC